DGAHTYRQLLTDTQRAAGALLGSRTDLAEARVAYIVEPSYAYVVTMIGAWRAGAMAVPIGTALPDPEIEYVFDDAAPQLLVADDAFAARIEPLARARGIEYMHVDQLLTETHASLPAVDDARAALMLYTS